MSLAPDRDKFRNASYAPAMLGISPYMKREELLNGCKYGIWPAVTPQTQRIFAKGHENERLARPIAEALVGHPLPPKRFTKGNLGATLDGYYLDAASLDSVNWECKSLNQEIVSAFIKPYAVRKDGIFCNVILPEYLCAQMEQQLMCSDADRCLFTARNDDECVHCWYESDTVMRSRIIDSWAQFEKDLAAMPDVMPVKAIEGQLMPVVRSFPQLPALQFGLVTGKTEVLKQFEQDSRQFVSTINQNLQTDQDFADGESDKKELIQCVERLDSLINAPQDLATLKRIRELFNTARLALEKQLTERKQARKAELVRATNAAYVAHVLALKTEHINTGGVDFRDSIKGLSGIASMQNALSAALLKAQSEVTALAAKVNKNLAMIAAAGNDLLFPNLRDLVTKTPEDLANHIAVTLAKAKALADAAAAKVAADNEEVRLNALPVFERAPVWSEPMGEVIDAEFVEPTPVNMAALIDAEEARLERGETVPVFVISSAAPSPKINIGQINERLKFVTVTTAQVVALGFPGIEGPRKGSTVWPESDYLRITAAIKANI